MTNTQELTYIAAITEALDVELARDPEVIIFGEDVAGPFGGAFKVTKPLTDKYPPERIFNTPMCENAFISMGTGMGADGDAAGNRDAVRRLYFEWLRQHRPVRRHQPLPLAGTGTVGDPRALRWAACAPALSTARTRRRGLHTLPASR